MTVLVVIGDWRTDERTMTDDLIIIVSIGRTAQPSESDQ